MKIDQDLIDEFIIESKENLHNFEKDILILESQVENPDLEIINNVFRAIHSIKGGASIIKCQSIEKLSHKMETLLQYMRDKLIIPESIYISPLLSGCDFLKSMLDDIDASSNIDFSDVFDEIENLIKNIENKIKKDQKEKDKKNIIKEKQKSQQKQQNADKDIICPEDDLFSSVSQNFKNQVNNAINSGNDRIVFDLSNVLDMDPESFSIFLLLPVEIKKMNLNAKLIIININEKINNLFNIIKLDKIYEIQSFAKSKK